MMIQSLGSWSARPRTAANQPEHAYIQEPTMAKQVFDIKALAGLQAYKLSKLTESLQCLASARKSNNPHAPPDPSPLT